MRSNTVPSSARWMLSLVLLIFIGVNSVHAQSVEQLLGERHLAATGVELEAAAGGREALIDELIKLREREVPPYLSVRAERALLSYAADEKVVSTLEADLANPEAQGLARIVALHLNKVPSASSRERLKKSIQSRAARDTSFAPFLRVVEEGNPPKPQ